MKRSLFLMGVAMFLFTAISCGGGGDGGGNNDDTCVDVAGKWEMTEVVDATNCGEGTYTEYTTYTVTQNGCNITVVPGSNTDLRFNGTVKGNHISWTGSWPEEGGTTTAKINVTINADSISGSASWSWTDGTERCSGTTQLTGTRTTSGNGEEMGTASVRFFNNLQCGDNNFTATLTVCGQTFSSYSGNWSSCDDITPDTCTVSLYVQTASCGTLSYSTSYSFEEGSVYNFLLDIQDQNPALGVYRQTGDCSTDLPGEAGVSGLGLDLEKIESVIDTIESNAGLQSIDSQ